MARADFYLLSGAGANAGEQFACRLTAKVFALDHKVHIRVADAEALARLDELLWTYDDMSFIPHDVVLDGDVDDASRTPVTLADASRPLPTGVDVCINLCHDPVDDACPRVAEVVCADETSRASGRQRYAHYRDRRFDLDTHQL